MRRLMMMMVALSFFGVLTGCKCVFSHGVCDCYQDDYCSSRSPWIRYNTSATAPPEAIPAPVPAKVLPNAPKGL